MKAQRSGTARRALAALTALPLAFAMSACRIGLGAEGSNPSPAASESSGTADPQTDSSSQANGNPRARSSQVASTWEGKAGNGQSFRVDINSVVVKEDVTTLTMTFTNTGSKIYGNWMYAFGDQKMLSDHVKLVDYSRHLVYSPGKAEDGTCICSGRQSSGLDTGESRTVYTTFKGLPADLTKVDVEIKGVGTPFENVPVTRE